jgi:hypothetical protein
MSAWRSQYRVEEFFRDQSGGNQPGEFSLDRFGEEERSRKKR